MKSLFLLRPLGAAIFIDSHIEKWLRQCSLCKSDSGGGMQVNEETCISLSSSKVGLYACTANYSANATFLFCLDSLLLALWSVAIIGTSYSTHKKQRHFPSRRESVRRSPLVRRLVFRLPPYNTAHDSEHNNPEFHVDRTHTAGGVSNTQNRLCEYIDVDYRATTHTCSPLYN